MPGSIRETRTAMPESPPFGRRATVFDEDDLIHLLKTSVGRAGGQSAFAKRHGVDRSVVNAVLHGKKSREWQHC